MKTQDWDKVIIWIPFIGAFGILRSTRMMNKLNNSNAFYWSYLGYQLVSTEIILGLIMLP